MPIVRDVSYLGEDTSLDNMLKNDNVLLIFTAQWCGACKYLENYINKDKEMEELLTKYDVNVLKVRNPSKHYNYLLKNFGPKDPIDVIPKLVAWKAGERVGEYRGAPPTLIFIEKIEKWYDVN